MIKVSETRSALRRLALTKVAKDSAQQAIDQIWDGYAAKHRGFTRSLTGAQATMNKLHERGLTAPGSGVASMQTTDITPKGLPVAEAQSSAQQEAQAADYGSGYAFGQRVMQKIMPSDETMGRIGDGIAWAADWPTHLRRWWGRRTAGSPSKTAPGTPVVGATAIKR